jgi:hypothetical protein
MEATTSKRIPIESFTDFARAMYDNGSGVVASHRLEDFYAALEEARRLRPTINWPRQHTLSLRGIAPGVQGTLEITSAYFTQVCGWKVK